MKLILTFLGAVFLPNREFQLVGLNLVNAEQRLVLSSVFRAEGAAVSISLGHRPRIHATKQRQR